MEGAPHQSISHVPMPPIISVKALSKTYGTGLSALKEIYLDIDKGEIFALLGPNGEGTTTPISIIRGIVTPSSSAATVAGHNIASDYRAARSMSDLVPQEHTSDMFETVWS